MSRPTAPEIAGAARALYGPPTHQPAPAEVGDKALWVDPGDNQALYQVQSGNWVRIALPPADDDSSIPAGTPVLYGPYIVDYTDIPHDGDTLTLWTPQVGDVLLKVIADWQTRTGWDHGLLFLGQNVDGTVSPPHNCIAAQQSFQNDPDGKPSFGAMDPSWWGSDYDASGGNNIITAHIFHSADPVQIQLAQTGGTDPTTGHVELYALVARAVAP